MEDTCIC